MGGRVTLQDVASRAGVSIKTVSNVVNDFDRVAPETRLRVQAVIDELGYRPNLSARQLRSGRTGVIALAVPDLAARYFAELATAVIAQARRHAMTVLIEVTGGERSAELAMARGLGSTLIDGVILSPLALSQADLSGKPGRVPVVLLGERDYAHTFDHVLIDNVAAAREATAHLLATGRKRVAAIGAQRGPASATAHLRMRGYQEAVRSAGAPELPELMAPATQFSPTEGAEAMRQLLALPEPPDAVFCFSDMLALGALRAAHEAGVRVPEDLAIAGFDDTEEGRYGVPSLTSVSPDKPEIARQAVALLADRIDSEGRPGRKPVRTEVGYELMVRESSAPARTTKGSL
ncbi:LacI family DNA-binding transcriptional regulator [Amycolatopsis jiangsuensis]|uniref:DNA-binding LacI/PurR family transcriptional regulator n=1 Tax=Amycolatopsis jiangsuensis TaxID=1181879 RepID=A0A840J367_9PSEU|nr:LacI family DNA-binding transcriptional regulator [Amycolatopsis jiangsuensis]MBB4689506.1 DNA-binding LacI/PurR family transcriptional regulator [Amycolatopsis jiangsuensis]